MYFNFFHQMHYVCPLRGLVLCVCFVFFFMKRDLSKVREEGDGKSSVLQRHHIKLHHALH